MKDMYTGYINQGDCYELWDGTIAYVHSMGVKYVECYIRERSAKRVWSWCLFTHDGFRRNVRTMYMEE